MPRDERAYLVDIKPQGMAHSAKQDEKEIKAVMRSEQKTW